MNSYYLSLIDKIDNIKNDIREDKYLDLMNTVKIIYDNSILSKIDLDSDLDSDSDNSQDMFFTMFEEYTCKCNTYTCESLCCMSFNLFRYCKNYQKIITLCPEICYIMKLNFHNIECNHKIKFIREITIYDDIIFNNKIRFNEILKILCKFIEISKQNIVMNHNITLILCNYVFKYFVHIKDNLFKIKLFKKIYEIIQYTRRYDSSYSNILIESGETTDILHLWIRNIRRFLPNDINNRLNIR